MSCGKSPEEKPVVQPEINIPAESQAIFSSGISFPEYTGTSAQTASLSFTATESWSTDVSDVKSSTWLSVQPSSGGAGTVNMTVSAQPNTGETARSGKVTIKCGSVTKIFSVTQAGNPPAVIAVESVSLDKPELNLLEGDDATLIATVSPDNATDKTVTWSTSDASIATVNNGKVKAIKEGKATITASAGEHAASCSITISSPIIYFDDTLFKSYCIENFDTNGDGEISISEASVVESISFAGLGVESLVGIEYFINLTDLTCPSNNLTSLDISNNTALAILNCRDNQIKEIDISKNTALKELYCQRNQLTSLIVGNNEALEVLYCNTNFLSSLDLQKCHLLNELACRENRLTSLNTSNNIMLEFLYCSDNLLSDLKVSSNVRLINLHCYSNQLTSVDISNNLDLEVLYCNDNQLVTLDISNNTQLRWLKCENNPISEIWLYTGQTLQIFTHDPDVNIYYK